MKGCQSMDFELDQGKMKGCQSRNGLDSTRKDEGLSVKEWAIYLLYAEPCILMNRPCTTGWTITKVYMHGMVHACTN